MATWPVGVEKSTILFGKGISPAGNPQAAKLQVYAEFGGTTKAIVWVGDGTAMLSITDLSDSASGAMGSVQVPVVDQIGWVDGSLNSITMWHYRIVETVGEITRTKFVQPLSGQSVIDFDMIPDGTVGIPGSTPVPPVTSVAGLTGAISGPSLLDALGGGSIDLSAVKNTLLDGLTIKRVTQAQYNAIPTPRPTDILYVIT